MPSRINFIRQKINLNRKRVFSNIKYPEIPLSSDDLYVLTIDGDRLDLLANQFYQDVDLWWVISIANPDLIRRDSMVLEPGNEIRIPSDINQIISLFEQINK